MRSDPINRAALRKTLKQAEEYVKLLEDAMDEFESGQPPATEEEIGEGGGLDRMTTMDYENCEIELDERDLEIMNLRKEIDELEAQKMTMADELEAQELWLDSSALTADNFEDEEFDKQRKLLALDGSKAADIDPDSDNTFAIKILQPLPAVQDQHLTLKSVKREPQGCADLLLEANNLKKFLDEFIKNHGASVSLAHIVPIQQVRQLTRHTPDLEDEYCVAVASQYCPKGSVDRWVDAIKMSESKYFNESFLMTNVNALLETLDDLSSTYECHHLGIKPNNLFVSRDGRSIMFGDWIPASHRIRLWTNYMYDKIYISPELYALKEEQRKKKLVLTEDLIRQKLDFYAHDLFCLGLCLYYLLTKTVPDKVS